MGLKMWIWRVTNPQCGAYLEGSGFWKQAARDSAMSARTKMTRAYELPNLRIVEVQVTGPRGSVEKLKPLARLASASRWARVR